MTVFVVTEEYQIQTEHQTNIIAVYRNYKDAKDRMMALYDDSVEWITSFDDVNLFEMDSNIISDRQTIVENGDKFCIISIEESNLY